MNWIFLVLWEKTRYNFGKTFNINDGTFTAPVHGIYYFYSQAKTKGGGSAIIDLQGACGRYSWLENNVGMDFVTLAATCELYKGSTVWVRLKGYFSTLRDEIHFDGHLIRQIHWKMWYQ